MALRLLEKGADVALINHLGQTALHLASQKGFAQPVETLIAHGADVSAVTNKGDTPLHLAARKGHDAVAVVLLQRGAQPDVKNSRGSTPLQTARSAKKEMVATLLQKHSSQNRLKRSDTTSTHTTGNQSIGGGAELAPVFRKKRRLTIEPHSNKKASGPGYVYAYTYPSYQVLQENNLSHKCFGADGLVMKIGYTQAELVGTRIKTQIEKCKEGHAEDPQILWHRYCAGNAYATEQHIHKALRQRNKGVYNMIGGTEWFVTSKEEVQTLFDQLTHSDSSEQPAINTVD